MNALIILLVATALVLIYLAVREVALECDDLLNGK